MVHAKYFSAMAYYHLPNLPGKEAVPDTDEPVSYTHLTLPTNREV